MLRRSRNPADTIIGRESVIECRPLRVQCFPRSKNCDYDLFIRHFLLMLSVYSSVSCIFLCMERDVGYAIMMNAQLFCEECGAANSGQLPYCHACHKPLTPPSPTSSAQNASATFRQVPVGNGRVAFQLAEPEQASYDVGPLPKGYVLNRRYKIIQQIGEGGFGIVYKARDKKRFNKLVAVKQINLDSLSPRDIIQATDSYNREVQLQTKLNNTHIPRIYQHFKDPKHWYLVMQYVRCETLEEYLKRVPEGKLPEHEVIQISMQLCKVLEYLHSHGIVFRDVKPANIMRTRRGKLYLIDFGIARRYVKSKSKDTVPLGSPGYAAPEQYGLAQTSAQTDIYGLGATLLTLLTGNDLADDTLGSPAQPVPPRIQSLIDSMLEREVYKRPATAEDVRIQLLLLSKNAWGKFLYQARPVTLGVFLGCVPLLFYFAFYLQSQSTDFLAVASSFCLSFMVALALVIVAIVLLFKPKQRLIGKSILITMFFLTLILTVGGLLLAAGIHLNL